MLLQDAGLKQAGSAVIRSDKLVCFVAEASDARLPIRPALISQVILAPYGARISSARRVNWMEGPLRQRGLC